MFQILFPYILNFASIPKILIFGHFTNNFRQRIWITVPLQQRTGCCAKRPMLASQISFSALICTHFHQNHYNSSLAPHSSVAFSAKLKFFIFIFIFFFNSLMNKYAKDNIINNIFSHIKDLLSNIQKMCNSKYCFHVHSVYSLSLSRWAMKFNRYYLLTRGKSRPNFYI